MWNVILDDDKKIGYIPIPKVANTSILNAMFKWKGDEVCKARLDDIPNENLKVKKDSPSIVHFYQKYLFDNVVRKSFNFQEHFIFSCVRHPVYRFISFYRDKILRWDPFIAEKLNSLGFFHEMNLDDAVNALLEADPIDLDHHLMPMSYFLYENGKLVPDFIFRLEGSQDGWGFVSSLAGINIPLLAENSSDSQGVKNIQLSDAQVIKLKEYYKDDMSLFGYNI
jgi:hypothetical protein